MKAYNMTYAPVRVFTNMLLADKFNGSSMLRNMAFDVKKHASRQPSCQPQTALRA